MGAARGSNCEGRAFSARCWMLMASTPRCARYTLRSCCTWGSLAIGETTSTHLSVFMRTLWAQSVTELTRTPSTASTTRMPTSQRRMRTWVLPALRSPNQAETACQTLFSRVSAAVSPLSLSGCRVGAALGAAGLSAGLRAAGVSLAAAAGVGPSSFVAGVRQRDRALVGVVGHASPPLAWAPRLVRSSLPRTYSRHHTRPPSRWNGRRLACVTRS